MLNELFTETFIKKVLQPIVEQIVRQTVENKFKEISNTQPNEDILLTRQEAMFILKISYTTIHNYTKNGLLNSQKSGKRHLYKKSDVLKFTKENL